MTHPVLSRIPFLCNYVDERFLEHRRRSLAWDGLSGVLVAGAILEYRLFTQHVISWDLVAILLTALLVKFASFAWLRLRD